MKTSLATAAIIKENDKIFLAQRKKNDNFPLYWEFPGGKVEKDETPEECLKREISEELGIEIEIISPFTFTLWDYKEFRILLLFFNCRIIKGKPKKIECSDWGWFGKEDVEKLKLLPADNSIIDIVF